MNLMFELPPGGVVGVLAIAVTALVTFTLGQFSFFGLEFLAHWQLSLGGSLPGFLLFSAVWGTGIQCIIWAGAGARAGPFGARAWARVGPGTQSWLGGLLVVLLLSWWLARDEHDCVLMAMPATSLLVFGLTLVCEGLVIHRIRAAGHDRAAFAALLALAALMMFSEGEIMAVDHFR